MNTVRSFVNSPDVLTGPKFHGALAAIAVFGFIARIYGISGQPLSGDDMGSALSAVNYMRAGQLGPTMWNHPPLRNVLIYFSTALFGWSVWGVKGVSIVLGGASVVLAGIFTRRVAGNPLTALVAALLMAVDPVHIDFSRQAIQEVHMPFFILGALVSVMRYRAGKNLFFLLLSGICFGLGTAAKWYVFFPLVFSIIFLATEERHGGARRMAEIALGLGAVPFATYLLVYAPWFQRGFGIGEWFSLQQVMYLETKSHLGYNPYDLELETRAWTWFLKPVGFADFTHAEGRPWIFIAITNPLVWLPVIPALFHALCRGIRQGNKDFLFLAGLFSITYLPLVFARRPIWLHTALSLTPYLFCLVGMLVVDVFSRMRRGRMALALYLALVLAVSAPLYALATGAASYSSVLRPVIELYRPANEH